MEVRVENGNLIAIAKHYHRIDPAIVWYANTMGCH
jgi:hypothetical protein